MVRSVLVHRVEQCVQKLPAPLMCVANQSNRFSFINFSLRSKIGAHKTSWQRILSLPISPVNYALYAIIILVSLANMQSRFVKFVRRGLWILMIEAHSV